MLNDKQREELAIKTFDLLKKNNALLETSIELLVDLKAELKNVDRSKIAREVHERYNAILRDL